MAYVYHPYGAFWNYIRKLFKWNQGFCYLNLFYLQLNNNNNFQSFIHLVIIKLYIGTHIPRYKMFIFTLICISTSGFFPLTDTTELWNLDQRALQLPFHFPFRFLLVTPTGETWKVYKICKCEITNCNYLRR